MSRHRAGDGVRAPWQPGTREALAGGGLDPSWVREFVVRCLAEDMGPGWVDITTAVTVPVDDDRRAEVVADEGGVVAGLLLLPVILAEAGARLELPVPSADLRVRDGARVRPGDVLADLRGPTRVLLVAQRTAVNLLRYLSGVATRTDRWVAELAGTRTGVLDTCGTTPGLRPLERYAVRCGGGTNGRAGLFDAAHVTAAHVQASGSLTAALETVGRRLPSAAVLVSVRTPLEAVEAVHAGARYLVCDAMAPEVLAGAVRQVRAAMLDQVEVAASGPIPFARAREYARTGVDHLFVDDLTRGPGVLDVSLLLPQTSLLPAQRR